MKKLILVIGLLFFPYRLLAVDVALSVDKLVPGAVYSGSLTANTEEAYNKIQWQDNRAKPTWSRIQDATIMIATDKAETNAQQEIEAKIQAEIRAMAIKNLVAKGEIPEGTK